MRNYFGKLVARHFNRVEGLQPRLASLFEPPLPTHFSDVRQRVDPGVFERAVPIETGEKAAHRDDLSAAIATDPPRPFRARPNKLSNSTRPSQTPDVSWPVVSLEQRQKSRHDSLTERGMEQTLSTSESETLSPPRITARQPPAATSPHLSAPEPHQQPLVKAEPPDLKAAGRRGERVRPQWSRVERPIGDDEVDSLLTPAIPVRQSFSLPEQPVHRKANDARHVSQLSQTTLTTPNTASFSESELPQRQTSQRVLPPREAEQKDEVDRESSPTGKREVRHRFLDSETIKRRTVIEEVVKRGKAPLSRSPLPVPVAAPTKQFAPPAPVLAHPQVTRYVEAPAPMQDGPVTPPEQVINVTIGRIEVRATPPAALPQKERREQQVRSLDQYLSQRAKGRG